MSDSGDAVGLLSAIPVVGPVFGVAGVGLKVAGASKSSACTANSFDQLNEQLQLQEEQIEQIQTDLSLVDNEFYEVFYEANLWETSAFQFEYNNQLTLLGGQNSLLENFLIDTNLAVPSAATCPAWSSQNPGGNCTPVDSSNGVSQCGNATCSSHLETQAYPTEPQKIQDMVNTTYIQVVGNQTDFQKYLSNIAGSTFEEGSHSFKFNCTGPRCATWPTSIPAVSRDSSSNLVQLLESAANTLSAQILARVSQISEAGFEATSWPVSTGMSDPCTGTLYLGKKYANSLAPENESPGSGEEATFGQMIADPGHFSMEPATEGTECSYEAFNVNTSPGFETQCFCGSIPDPDSSAPSNANLVTAYEGYNSTLASIFQNSLHGIQQALFMEYAVNVLNYSSAQNPTSGTPFSECDSSSTQLQSESWGNVTGTKYDCNGTPTPTSAVAQQKAFNLAQFNLAGVYATRVNLLYRIILSYVFSDTTVAPQEYPSVEGFDESPYQHLIGSALLETTSGKAKKLARTPIGQLELMSPGFNSTRPSDVPAWNENAVLYQYGGIQDVEACGDAVLAANVAFVEAGTGGSLVDAFSRGNDDCPEVCSSCASGLSDLNEGGTGLADGVCVNWCSADAVCGSRQYAARSGGTDCSACIDSACPSLLQDVSGADVGAGYYDGVNLQPYTNIPAYGLQLCPAECYTDPSVYGYCAGCPDPALSLAGSMQSNISPTQNPINSDISPALPLNPYISVSGTAGSNQYFFALCEPGNQKMGWYQPSGDLVGNDAKLRAGQTYLTCGNAANFDLKSNWRTFIEGNSSEEFQNVGLLMGYSGAYPATAPVNMATCGHQDGDYLATIQLDSWACGITATPWTQDVNSNLDNTACADMSPDGSGNFQFGEIKQGDANGGQTDEVFFNMGFPSVVESGALTYLPLAMFGQCTNTCGELGLVSCLTLSAYGNPSIPCTSSSCSSSAEEPTIAGNGYACDYFSEGGALVCTLADGRTYSMIVSRTANAAGTFSAQLTNSGCEASCLACYSGGGADDFAISGATDVVKITSTIFACEDYCSGYGFCGTESLYSDYGSTNCSECQAVPAGSWLDTCEPLRWDSTTLCAYCTTAEGTLTRSCASCTGDYTTNSDGLLTCAAAL
ncbi:MAG TPA: hypothetical protein EYQ54_20035 [Myxococcales bacterium]|nr:hypothetical protein [Myxococcales bacterium]